MRLLIPHYLWHLFLIIICTCEFIYFIYICMVYFNLRRFIYANICLLHLCAGYLNFVSIRGKHYASYLVAILIGEPKLLIRIYPDLRSSVLFPHTMLWKTVLTKIKIFHMYSKPHILRILFAHAFYLRSHFICAN